MPPRGTMVCCFSHGVLTRAEREAIAKLRERREQGHVPGTTTHVATADRMDPLVSFYSSPHLATPSSRAKLHPGLHTTHSNSRPSGPPRNTNHARHPNQVHGNVRPPKPNCHDNRSELRPQRQANHNLHRHQQKHPQQDGVAGASRPHVPRSVKGDSDSDKVPVPSETSHTSSSTKAPTAEASTRAKTAAMTKLQRAKTQHRIVERRPGAGLPVSRTHAAIARPTLERNANTHQNRVEGGVASSMAQVPPTSGMTYINRSTNTATATKTPHAPPPPPSSSLTPQKSSGPSRPPAPHPSSFSPQTRHPRVGGSGNIVKMSSQGLNPTHKPLKPHNKAKSFGDSYVKTKDNSLRSNAHARTDVRPLHVAESAPRVRVNVRAINGADWRRQRRGGRTAGRGSAFAAVSAALGRCRGALQPSAAIVDTSIVDAVATPSSVRAREGVTDRRERDGPRVGKENPRRDATPVAQGVSTMLKALTLLHVSRTAGMTGTSTGTTRSQAFEETDTDEDVDSDILKDKENRTIERKVGRIAWASKKRLEDVVSKFSGQSAKGERFVMKARPQLSDLADANNDVYFQKLMNDDH